MTSDYSHLLTDLERAETKALEKLNPDQKLSLCMIVKNEEKYLPGALESVQGVVDEIIIVDTGSTDRTVEIAREYGAKVYFRPWDDDFAAARNESLKHATGQWVLIMDADERVPAEKKQNLRALLVDTSFFFSYALFIKSYVKNKYVKDETGHHLTRMFRKTEIPEVKFYGAVHEQIHPGGAVRIPKESFFLEHLGYLDSEWVARKQMNRNRPLIEEQLRKAIERKDDAAHSFYAFYMATSGGTYAECLDWLMESIDKGGATEATPHVQAAISEVLKIFFTLRRYKDGIAFGESKLMEAPILHQDKSFLNIMGALYLVNQDYQKAVDFFEEIIKIGENTENLFHPIEHESTASWATYLNLTLAYKLLEDIERASLCAEKALKTYPQEDKDVILERVAAILNDHTLIDRYFEESIFDGEGYTVTQIKNLANHYLRQDLPYNAIMLQKQAYHFEKVVENASLLTLNYIDQKRYDLAFQTLDAIQVLFTESEKSDIVEIGKYYLDCLMESEVPKKTFILERLKNKLTLPTLKLMLHMTIYYSLDDETKLLLEKIDEQDHVYVELRKALLEQNQGLITDAVRRLEAVIKNDITCFDAYIQLGNILLGQGDFLGAEKVLKVATRLRNLDWYVYYAQALSLAGQNRFNEAKQMLSIAARLSSGNQMVIDAIQLIRTYEDSSVLA